MSAYLVDPEHIHVLLHAAVYRWPGQHDLSWPTSEAPSAVNAVEDRHWALVQRLTSSTMDVIGQLLVDANAASVNHRYDEDNAYVYAWQRPRHIDWSPVELLSAIAGYEYQACETPDWATSEAHEFCSRLRQVVIRHLPGWDAGPWTITPDSTPAHVEAAR